MAGVVYLPAQLFREAQIGGSQSNPTQALKKVRPYQKITNTKRSGGMAQVVEHHLVSTQPEFNPGTENLQSSVSFIFFINYFAVSFTKS
jgi:hypothetical protein